MVRKDRILGVISIFLALVLLTSFILNFVSRDIIIDKNHEYCVDTLYIGEINVDTQHKTITNESRTIHFDPECTEIEWTLNDFISASPLLMKTVSYGIPLLSLILFVISFIVLFIGEGWPRKASKIILITPLFLGFLSFFLIILIIDGLSLIPIILLLVWLIALLTMSNLIIKFDKNKIKKSIITVVLGVIIYSIISFLIYSMVLLPYSYF